MDAWVAVLGAPMAAAKSRHYFTLASLSRTAAEPVELFGLFEKQETPYRYKNKQVAPWDQDTAYRHSIVMGNNGVVLNRSIHLENALAFHREITFNKPSSWLSKKQNKLVFYAHGGLNDEDSSIARVRVLGPYFKANGIYPIFLTWKTGFLESLWNIMGDKIHGIEPQGVWRGIWESIKKAAKEAKDRAIEEACQRLLVKAVWSQMKQNAEAASQFQGAALGLTVKRLIELKRRVPNLELHLVGHSAGSILLGYLLDLMLKENIQIKSCTLLAPACTIEFALNYYKPAMDSNGIVAKSATRFEILTNERELADTVGPYGKSLLYLVSRALEDYHKTPILGMENAWYPKTMSEWNSELRNHVKQWQKFIGEPRFLRIHGKDRTQVSDGRGMIPLAHGSFDNDVKVMTETMTRILGKKLRYPIENLRGY